MAFFCRKMMGKMGDLGREMDVFVFVFSQENDDSETLETDHLT